jgi:3-oxoacyl-[acyl-carrier protein] reductase
MDLGLEGKIALVTGGSSGIGKAVALRLVEEGAKVTIASRSTDKLQQAAQEIAEVTGTSPATQTCDLTELDEVDRLVGELHRAHGRIDVVFANTGGPSRGVFTDYEDEEWTAAFEQSVLSFVRLFRAVVPIMRAQNSGSIVTLTSSSARQPIDGHWLSNVMRPGVWGLVKTLSNELAPHGVRVNNISPGRILTERNVANDKRKAERLGVSVEEAQAPQLKRAPMGRFGEPGEVADAAAYLLSDRASYITGVTLHVDGGMVKSL